MPEEIEVEVREAFKRALKPALPIIAGYIVLGLPCGILSATAGMSWWMVAILSIVFYSGAGQYMIPNMWLAANPITAIIASVGLVNTRQMLYGTSLSQFCGNAGKGLATFFGATVTDESFGVNYAKFLEGDWSVKDALAVNLYSQTTWMLSCTVGCILGYAVAVPSALASFAMTSLFLCLLCMQPTTAENGVVVAAAVLGVVVCKLVGLSGAAIFLGAVIGIVCGMLFGSRVSRAAKQASCEKGGDR